MPGFKLPVERLKFANGLVALNLATGALVKDVRVILYPFEVRHFSLSGAEKWEREFWNFKIMRHVPREDINHAYQQGRMDGEARKSWLR